MKRNADELKSIIKEAGLTRLQAAGLLHVSIETLHAWLKPPTSKSSNPCPLWAVELLGFKAGSGPLALEYWTQRDVEKKK